MERLEVRGRGPGLHTYSLNPDLEASWERGHGDLGSDLHVEEEPAKEGASQTADPGSRAHGKWEWGKLDVRAALPGRVHAERVRRPQWGP